MSTTFSMINSIINADCFNILPTIESGSVDFILTDPPYGMTAAQWDSQLDFMNFWKEAKRVIKPNGVIAVFAAQPFTTKLIHSNFDQYKYCW